MHKVIIGLTIGLSVGTWTGAEIVHRTYYPTLIEQAQEIEDLLNTREEEICKVKESLELCQSEYVKQHKNGRDFITNAWGITLDVTPISDYIKQQTKGE